MTQVLITTEITLGELMLKYPQLVEVLSKYGMPSTGCSIPVSETLGESAKKYVAGENVEKMLEELNSAAVAIAVDKKDRPEKIEVSDAAVKKVKEILARENKQGFNLRVEVKPGGCAGMSYEFSLDDEIKTEDSIIEKGSLKVVVDKSSLENLKGAKIDYVETLQRSGFRVDNPNAHAVCSCGQSFG